MSTQMCFTHVHVRPKHADHLMCAHHSHASPSRFLTSCGAYVWVRADLSPACVNIPICRLPCARTDSWPSSRGAVGKVGWNRLCHASSGICREMRRARAGGRARHCDTQMLAGATERPLGAQPGRRPLRRATRSWPMRGIACGGPGCAPRLRGQASQDVRGERSARAPACVQRRARCGGRQAEAVTSISAALAAHRSHAAERARCSQKPRRAPCPQRRSV